MWKQWVSYGIGSAIALALLWQLGDTRASQALPSLPSQERESHRVILDVDPGVDDALAILLALQSPEVSVEAITVVSGNVVVELGTENALKMVEVAMEDGLQVQPIVAAGAKYALQAPLVTAEIFNGANGIAGVQLPSPALQPDPRHGADVIVDLVNEYPGEVTLVPLGPLTNIALAMLKDPALGNKIAGIVLMGGSTIGGNASPAAEANILADPEAAKIVFASGVPMTMVGLAATSQAILTRDDIDEIRQSGTPVATTAADLADGAIDIFQGLFGSETMTLYDPLAVGIAINPDFVLDAQPMFIDVETKGQLTYGETVANRSLSKRVLRREGDHYTIAEFVSVAPNAVVPLEVDGNGFTEFFVERLSIK